MTGATRSSAKKFSSSFFFSCGLNWLMLILLMSGISIWSVFILMLLIFLSWVRVLLYLMSSFILLICSTKIRKSSLSYLCWLWSKISNFELIFSDFSISRFNWSSNWRSTFAFRIEWNVKYFSTSLANYSLVDPISHIVCMKFDSFALPVFNYWSFFAYTFALAASCLFCSASNFSLSSGSNNPKSWLIFSWSLDVCMNY